MSLFTVDKAKCKFCGLCALVCPVQLIKFDKRGDIPAPIESAEKRCINCGHCLAVCRFGAFALASMPEEACRELKPGWRIPFHDLEDFLKSRRSVRIYKPEPVSRETLAKLIDVARYAPSGINRQPLKWAVILEPGKVRQIAAAVVNWMQVLVKSNSPLAASLSMENLVTAWDKGADWVCRGAPHLICAYALKGDLTAAQSATTALTYLELAAAAHNLGACWAGYVQIAVNSSLDVRKLTGIPSRTECFGAMMIGYPGVNYSRIPLRNTPHVIWR